jgi:hypothetical protein
MAGNSEELRSNQIANSRVSNIDEYRKPTGHELALKIERLSPTHYQINLKNVSEVMVFCVCLLSDKDRVASYFPFIVKEKDTDAGGFNVVETGGHFAPGFSELAPGKEVSFRFSRVDEGIYRLKFSYLIDPQAVQMLKSKSVEAEDRKKLIDSYFEMVTPEFEIGNVKH